MGAANRKKSSGPGGRWAIAIVIFLIVAGGVWLATQHPWRVPKGQATVPDFHGQAVQDAQKAGFTTVEQLLGGTLKVGSIYKVEAQLQRYALDRGNYTLTLGSLVNPSTTIKAEIPPSTAAANPDDGALYAELRQDFALRFAAPTAGGAAPAQPTKIVITGVLARNGSGWQLRPVLDLHVQ